MSIAVLEFATENKEYPNGVDAFTRGEQSRPGSGNPLMARNIRKLRLIVDSWSSRRAKELKGLKRGRSERRITNTSTLSTLFSTLDTESYLPDDVTSRRGPKSFLLFKSNIARIAIAIGIITFNRSVVLNAAANDS